MTVALAFLDLIGTPMLLSTSTADLTIGCSGSGNVRIMVGTGNVVTPVSSPAEGTAATTIANSATIAATPHWSRVTNAGAVTGIILGAGTLHGQRKIVSVDKDAGGTVTMAAAGTSRVGTGVACVLAVGAAREFIWDNTDLIWCELGET